MTVTGMPPALLSQAAAQSWRPLYKPVVHMEAANKTKVISLGLHWTGQESTELAVFARSGSLTCAEVGPYTTGGRFDTLLAEFGEKVHTP